MATRVVGDAWFAIEVVLCSPLPWSGVSVRSPAPLSRPSWEWSTDCAPFTALEATRRSWSSSLARLADDVIVPE